MKCKHHWIELVKDYFRCSKCGEKTDTITTTSQYVSPAGLEKLSRRSQEGKNYTCEKCAREFDNGRSLNAHDLVVHRGIDFNKLNKFKKK